MKAVTVRAIRTLQGNCEVFAFFLPGERLLEIADISRIASREGGGISGFQRPEIRSHVRNIVEYLARGPNLFPNAIIIALAPGTRFNAARGTKPTGIERVSDAGTLRIPARPGRKAGWIVDGQQRTLALREAGASALPVPVVAFISGDLAVHREQFILVNKARPLDRRLIDELLPTVGTMLPRDLSTRRVPTTLCAALVNSSDSPFHHLVKRPSLHHASAVVNDSTLTNLIRRSLQDPRGALAACVDPDGVSDTDAMYQLLVAFWSAVKDVFPDAWGLPPDRSRLMHAAGLTAMGVLMDQIMTRSLHPSGDYAAAKAPLSRIAPHCRWTEGRWDALNRDWNDIQCTPKDVRLLSNYLIQLEREVSRLTAA